MNKQATHCLRRSCERYDRVKRKRPAMTAHLKVLREKGFVESPSRGVFQLTEQGLKVFERACGR